MQQRQPSPSGILSPAATVVTMENMHHCAGCGLEYIVSLLLPSGLHVILVTSGIVVYVKVSLMNQMIQFISVENV